MNAFPFTVKQLMGLVGGLALIFLLGLLLQLNNPLNVLNSWFTTEGHMRIESSEIDLGRLIAGKKISIRDQIRLTKTAAYVIEGPMGPLSNERKLVEIAYLAEIGYWPEDIIRSERIDTFDNEAIKSRTLLLELPLPDTLSFMLMREELRNQEEFWEGWLESPEVMEKRQLFIDSLHREVYRDFQKTYFGPNLLGLLEEATRSLASYVNHAYQITHEKGFDTVIARFQYQEAGQTTAVTVQCLATGSCQITRSLLQQKNPENR